MIEDFKRVPVGGTWQLDFNRTGGRRSIPPAGRSGPSGPGGPREGIDSSDRRDSERGSARSTGPLPEPAESIDHR